MRSINILITSTGSPGTTTLIRKLKGTKERQIRVVAVDMNPEAGGRFLSDEFYCIPPAHMENEYIESLISVLKKENIDVFFPVSDYEIPVIAKNKERILKEVSVKIIINDYNTIINSNNKYLLYKTLKEKTSVEVPNFYYPRKLEEFIKYSRKLGYPDKKICFKPHVSKGSRGFRIISDSISKKDLLLNYKPNSLYMSMDEFIDIFSNETFPDLLVMEYLDDINYDAMILGNGKESLLTTIKTREESRWGTIVKGELIYNEKIINYCDEIVKVFGLKYNNSIQFIGNKIIEINPRTSTYIYGDDFNEPYLSVKKVLGEITDDEIRDMRKDVPYGLRMCRYMDQISF